NSFVEPYALDEHSREFATYYHTSQPVSRLDLIWFSEMLLSSYFYVETWFPSNFLLNTNPGFILDHCDIASYFSCNLFIGDLPIHHVKQKKAWHSFYDVKNATDSQWISFSDYVSSHLLPSHNEIIYDVNSVSFPFNKQVINRHWFNF